MIRPAVLTIAADSMHSDAHGFYRKDTMPSAENSSLNEPSDNPIEVFIRCVHLRIRAEREQLRAWNLFREKAMAGGATLEQCDVVWATIKAVAEQRALKDPQ